MIPTIILLSIFVIGLFTLIRRRIKIKEKYDFAFEYREKFMDMASKYYSTYDSWTRDGKLDSDLYLWLIKNVNKIQNDLGHSGTLHYVAPFRAYSISNYQVVINTIPKFRTGQIESFDISSTDDCLLRYMGILEKVSESIRKKLKNPIIWFKEGFQEIISLPLYFFNWFGILGDRAISKVTNNIIFNLLSGLGGLVAFISGIVTIIQGKEQTISFIKNLFHK